MAPQAGIFNPLNLTQPSPLDHQRDQQNEREHNQNQPRRRVLEVRIPRFPDGDTRNERDGGDDVEERAEMAESAAPGEQECASAIDRVKQQRVDPTKDDDEPNEIGGEVRRGILINRSQQGGLPAQLISLSALRGNFAYGRRAPPNVKASARMPGAGSKPRLPATPAMSS